MLPSLERLHVKPGRPGLLVPDPDHGGRPLPAEGLEVVSSSYWVRRLQDGDVVLVGSSSRKPDSPRSSKPEKA